MSLEYETCVGSTLFGRRNITAPQHGGKANKRQSLRLIE